MEPIKKAVGFSQDHSEEQKKKLYDSLPQERREKQSYTEWVKEAYHEQYERWMPWIEDQYLKWFGKDNKASYVAKDSLDKSKVTGITQIDRLQDDANTLGSSQIGKEGILRPVGDLASKEGINRLERGGRDESGSYGGPATSVVDPAIKSAHGAGHGLVSGAKGVGGYLSGALGGRSGE